jgi:alpha-L-arabinofuranosidase
VERVPGSLEANRWYDIKVVLNGSQMECYLDGNLVQKAEVLPRRVPALFTSATLDKATGETILKVVNPGDDASQTTIQLNGASRIQPMGQATILTGELTAENQVGKPEGAAPKTEVVTGVQPEFNYTFQPRSMTVLRLGTQAGSN